MALAHLSPIEFEVYVQVKQIRQLSRTYELSPEKILEMIGITLAEKDVDSNPIEGDLKRPKVTIRHSAAESVETVGLPHTPDWAKLREEVLEAMARLEQMDIEG